MVGHDEIVTEEYAVYHLHTEELEKRTNEKTISELRTHISGYKQPVWAHAYAIRCVLCMHGMTTRDGKRNCILVLSKMYHRSSLVSVKMREKKLKQKKSDEIRVRISGEKYVDVDIVGCIMPLPMQIIFCMWKCICMGKGYSSLCSLYRKVLFEATTTHSFQWRNARVISPSMNLIYKNRVKYSADCLIRTENLCKSKIPQWKYPSTCL